MDLVASSNGDEPSRIRCRTEPGRFGPLILQGCMSDKEISAILGLKSELKAMRERARTLKDETSRWRNVALALRKLAGLDDAQFRNLLKAESLPCE